MAHATILDITQEDYNYLQSLCRCRTLQAQIVDRAKMLIYKAQGCSNTAIAGRLDVNINTVKPCIKKFTEGGVQAALYDAQRSGRPAEITDDAIAWVIDTACQRPADLGYAQELWTLESLRLHIQKNAAAAGFARLSSVAKSTVQQILKKSGIKPFKIKYYCEKRDPEFESKMHDVLLVYKQVEMQFDENGELIVPDGYKITITVSYDEKPGIQAIANTSEDLRPTGGNGEVYRHYEYKRLGTLSLLAGIDLLTGEAIPLVSDTHKCSDFIRFLNFENTGLKISVTGHHTGHFRQPFCPYIKRNKSIFRFHAKRTF